MKIKFKLYDSIYIIILVGAFLTAYFISLPDSTTKISNEGCTIGVVSGNSTADGRPLLWKVRDNSEMPYNAFVYNTRCRYKFIAVINSGDTNVWMGVNEKGLAIVNSTSYDLPGTSNGFSNGSLIYYALGYCSTVSEFENVLIKTNADGRRTRANFALIDSAGAAVIFETGGKEYWKFDANDKSQSPNGYVVRTNFSFTGGGNTGIERYRRTISLVEDLYQKNDLSHQSLIKYHVRDFSNEQSEPVNVPFKDRWYGSKPFGYINSNYSVCRRISLSAAVFHGILPSESAATTTMWTALGHPSATLVLPYWPVGKTPEVTCGNLISPMYKVSETIKSYLYDDQNNRSFFDSYKLRDDNNYGIWNKFSSFEDSIITEVNSRLRKFRLNELPADNLLRFEHQLVESGYSVLSQVKSDLEKLIKIEVLNEKPWHQINNITFNDGNAIQLIAAGDNGKIDLPVFDKSSISFGMPGGDDYLIGDLHQLSENSNEAGKFFFQLLLWKNYYRFPTEGDQIYLRLFDSENLITAVNYGNSQIYDISDARQQQFKPEITEVFRLHPKEQTPDLAAGKNLEFNLTENYPNPFNPVTNFNYSIPADANVKIEIFNSLGEKVQTLVEDIKSEGEYSVQFDARGFASGIYYYKLTADKFVSIKKMLMIK